VDDAVRGVLFRPHLAVFPVDNPPGLHRLNAALFHLFRPDLMTAPEAKDHVCHAQPRAQGDNAHAQNGEIDGPHYGGDDDGAAHAQNDAP